MCACCFTECGEVNPYDELSLCFLLLLPRFLLTASSPPPCFFVVTVVASAFWSRCPSVQFSRCEEHAECVYVCVCVQVELCILYRMSCCVCVLLLLYRRYGELAQQINKNRRRCKRKRSGEKGWRKRGGEGEGDKKRKQAREHEQAPH